ncbi:hypothetical protein F5Y16DRAFT_386903, partial [Xylariaceae sp. FL0255]
MTPQIAIHPPKETNTGEVSTTSSEEFSLLTALTERIARLQTDHGLQLPEITAEEDHHYEDINTIGKDMFKTINDWLSESTEPLLLTSSVACGHLQSYVHNEMQKNRGEEDIEQPEYDGTWPSSETSIYTSFKAKTKFDTNNQPENMSLACLLYIALDLLRSAPQILVKWSLFDEESQAALLHIPEKDERAYCRVPGTDDVFETTDLEAWAVRWVAVAAMEHWPGTVWFVNDSTKLLRKDLKVFMARTARRSIWINDHEEMIGDRVSELYIPSVAKRIEWVKAHEEARGRTGDSRAKGGFWTQSRRFLSSMADGMRSRSISRVRSRSNSSSNSKP